MARPIGVTEYFNRLRNGDPPQKPVLGLQRALPINEIELNNRYTSSAAANQPRLPFSPGTTKVRRGQLTIPSRGVGRIFMYNPSEIDDAKSVNWGTTEVPGSSHPVHQYGAGGERLITFNLYVDGDRGRFGREQARNTGSLSIKDELYWYRALTLPVGYSQSQVLTSPFICLFTYGQLYESLPVIVKKADWKVNYWLPDPTNSGKVMPVRATISIILSERPQRSQTAADFLASSGVDYQSSFFAG